MGPDPFLFAKQTHLNFVYFAVRDVGYIPITVSISVHARQIQIKNGTQPIFVCRANTFEFRIFYFAEAA